MSGEQWGEAVDAADLNTRVARALWTAHAIHNEVKSNWDELEQPYRDLWLAYAQAAAPLIVADTRRKVAEEITDNVRNADFAKQDRGVWSGFTECMAYVAGHDKAAAIARGIGNGGTA